MIRFSLLGLEEVGELLVEYVAQFGYEDMFMEMIRHHNDTQQEVFPILFQTLYPQLPLEDISNPSETFCSRLTSNQWHWGGLLG